VLLVLLVLLGSRCPAALLGGLRGRRHLCCRCLLPCQFSSLGPLLGPLLLFCDISGGCLVYLLCRFCWAAICWRRRRVDGPPSGASLLAALAAGLPSPACSSCCAAAWLPEWRAALRPVVRLEMAACASWAQLYTLLKAELQNQRVPGGLPGRKRPPVQPGRHMMGRRHMFADLQNLSRESMNQCSNE